MLNFALINITLPSWVEKPENCPEKLPENYPTVSLSNYFNRDFTADTALMGQGGTPFLSPKPK